MMTFSIEKKSDMLIIFPDTATAIDEDIYCNFPGVGGNVCERVNGGYDLAFKIKDIKQSLDKRHYQLLPTTLQAMYLKMDPQMLSIIQERVQYDGMRLPTIPDVDFFRLQISGFQLPGQGPHLIKFVLKTSDENCEYAQGTDFVIFDE